MTAPQVKGILAQQFVSIDSDLQELKLASAKRKFEVMRDLIFEGLDLLGKTLPDTLTEGAIYSGASIFKSTLEVLHSEAIKRWEDRATEVEIERVFQGLYSSLMTGKGFTVRNARKGELLIEVNNHNFFQALQILRSLPQDANPKQQKNPIVEKETGVMNSNSIFISHCEKDKPLVDKLHDLLVRGLGMHPDDFFITCLDGQGIDAGESVREEIRSTLVKAKAVVCLITPNYKNSEPCLNELGAAWALKKRVVGLISNPLPLGKAAFLIDVDSQLRLQDKAKLSALGRFITDTPQISASFKSERWTSRLEEFFLVLENAIVQCNFSGAKTEPVLHEAAANREGYTDQDYILMICEYFTSESAREITLHYSDLDSRLKIPTGTSKRLMADAAREKGYEIRMSDNTVFLRKPRVRLERG